MSNIFQANNIITNRIGVNNSTPQEVLDISGTLVVSNIGSINLIYSTGNYNGYQQVNIGNYNPGTNSSSDIVATSNIGNENSYYVNLGINSSNYSGQSIGYSGDSYLFSQANDFYIGNASGQRKIYFFVTGNITGINGALVVMENGRVGVSGNLYAPGGLVLNTTDSGNILQIIQNSGQTNYRLTTGLSGASNSTFATISNLQSTGQVLNSKAQLYIPLSVGSVTWSSMPGGVTLFNGNSSSISFVDLTQYTGVNLIVNKGATVGSATGAIFLGYRGDANQAAANYLPIDTLSAKQFINVTGQLLSSGFLPLVAAARSGIYIALLGSGGAALSPIFGNITAIFK